VTHRNQQDGRRQVALTGASHPSDRRRYLAGPTWAGVDDYAASIANTRIDIHYERAIRFSDLIRAHGPSDILLARWPLGSVSDDTWRLWAWELSLGLTSDGVACVFGIPSVADEERLLRTGWRQLERRRLRAGLHGLGGIWTIIAPSHSEPAESWGAKFEPMCDFEDIPRLVHELALMAMPGGRILNAIRLEGIPQAFSLSLGRRYTECVPWDSQCLTFGRLTPEDVAREDAEETKEVY
jgi:hypothetical protein